MKRPLLVTLAVLAAGAIACSSITINLPELRTGPTETLTLSEPSPASGQAMDVVLEMGAGNLQVSGGAPGLLSGTIRYNVPEWKPEVIRGESRVEVRQGKGTTAGFPDSDVVNDWQIELGDFPMSLSLMAGAYRGTLDLGGLPLQSLNVTDGASQAEVTFSSPNPQRMSLLSYRTGASSVTLKGLGNANFDLLTFEGGAGDYTLDFSGDLRHEARVNVRAGASAVHILVPSGSNVEVVTSGGLSSVQTQGEWQQEGQRYVLSGSGPQITISVDMGLGSLFLVVE